ncbi:MAG: hypothetical protein QW701_01950 [Candidatus Nezhaarchaeales archaeon]
MNGKGRTLGVALFSITLVVLLLSVAPMVLASKTFVKVNVHAKANGDDIVVSGKVFLQGVEGNPEVYVTIVLSRDGEKVAQGQLVLQCPSVNGVTKIPYSYVFEDCITVKGLYVIEVTATCGDLTAKATFKFDPPGGGTPGVPNLL